MKALIIGINSDFGREISKKLYSLDYELILVSKSKKKLEQLNEELKNAEIIQVDVASIYNCKKLFNKVKDENIDIVINCEEMEINEPFNETKIDKELDLIDLNIKSTHTLTKLFLEDFDIKNKGSILNICSTSAFSSNPLKCTYSASKSYILSLTNSIHEELKVKKSNVYIGCYCTSNDPIENQVEYAINGLQKRKTIIIPKGKRFNIISSKIAPRKTILKKNYKQV